MKEENKKCWSCGRFQIFYTKGYCNLQKENIGFCSFQNKIVAEISSIVDIRSKLEVIEQILMEESELGKIKNEK